MPLLQVPLWPGVKVSAPSIGQIDLFKIISIQLERMQKRCKFEPTMNMIL